MISRVTVVPDDVATTLRLLRHPMLMKVASSTPLLRYLRRHKLRRWARSGRPVPPPSAFKQELLANYGRRFGLRVLVESGTFVGLTVAASLPSFDRIYSIELDQELAGKAAGLFRSFPQVTILQGDSGVVLPKILADLDRPALFWLDAHYSGGITARGGSDTPVEAELRSILDHPVPGHAVLIDDAREFGTQPGYPDVRSLRELVLARRPRWTLQLEDDVIRIHP